jgi:3-oxoacyl-[acyl-carrier protein] reductase
MSLDEFNNVIAVDLRGVFLCGREAAVHVVEIGRGGVIINISSISRAGNIGQTNYSAAKAGVAVRGRSNTGSGIAMSTQGWHIL